MRHPCALLAALAAAALAASARPAAAQACPTATLAAYIGGAVGPCTVAAVTFSGFTGTYARNVTGFGANASPASAANILVTPTSGVMGSSSYASFRLSWPLGDPLYLQIASNQLLVGNATSSLLLGATASLGVGNAFERLIVPSGTVLVQGSGLGDRQAVAAIRATDVGGATTGVQASTSPPLPVATASCTPATCNVPFDGGAFELSSEATASALLFGIASAAVSPYEVRFTYAAVTAVPEPATVGLVALGLAVAAPLARRRR